MIKPSVSLTSIFMSTDLVTRCVSMFKDFNSLIFVLLLLFFLSLLLQSTPISLSEDDFSKNFVLYLLTSRGCYFSVQSDKTVIWFLYSKFPLCHPYLPVVRKGPSLKISVIIDNSRIGYLFPRMSIRIIIFRNKNFNLKNSSKSILSTYLCQFFSWFSESTTLRFF